ncbi:Dbl homology domain-containing protein [Syncephalis fuscata]|nr:Dbl homology domain-containing protein [Syncephalis fuscata]
MVDSRRIQRTIPMHESEGLKRGNDLSVLDQMQRQHRLQQQQQFIALAARNTLTSPAKLEEQILQGVRISRQSALVLAALKSPTKFHRISSSNYYTTDSTMVSKPLDALTDPSTQRRGSRLSTLSRSRSVELKDSRFITDVIAEADIALELAEAAERRRMVVSELVNTEAAFASDLAVLIDVYYEAAKVSPLFRPLDIRVLFTNIEHVKEHADIFLKELAEASKMMAKNDGKTFIFKMPTKSEKINDGGNIGSIFLNQLKRMEYVYADYCKRFDAAMERLQDLESQSQYMKFFMSCKEQLAGKTTSWDLGSLLIKPVQRVLKYPLLIQEILKHTDAEHSDHRQLLRLSGELQNMADRINEVKRRKEVVEGIVGGRKRSVDIRHGLQKRFNRNTRKLLQRAGRLDESVDEQFNELYERFLLQQRLIRVFLEDAESWVQNLRTYFEWQRIQATSFEDIYLVSRDPLWKISHGKQILAYRACMARIATETWQNAQRDVRLLVREPIERLLELYKGPHAVITKRSKKLIDYDRVRDMKQRNDKPDRMTQASANTYVAINAQLIEELPLFFQCTGRIFNLIALDLAKLQADTYRRLNEESKDTFEQLKAKGFCRGDIKDVVADHQNAMEGEFGFTTLLMELSVVNGSWRDLSK